MFWLKKAALFFGCVLCCFAHADESHAKKYKIACFVRTLEDNYLSELTQEFKKKFAADFEFFLYEAGNDIGQQVKQLNDCIAEGKADLVLMNIAQSVFVTEVLDILKQHDIPSIFFKNEPNIRVFSNYENAVVVSNNGVEEGRRQGRLLDLIWNAEDFDKNKDGVVQYILFQGPAGNFEAISRTLYAVNTAKDLGLKLEQLGENNIANWSDEEAYRLMPEIMKKYGKDIELIISNNDNMALGALKFLNEQGINIQKDDIPIIGFDGIKEAKEKIEKGVMTATVVQELGDIAQLIKEMAINHFNGRDWLYATEYSWEVDNISVRVLSGYHYLARKNAYGKKIVSLDE